MGLKFKLLLAVSAITAAIFLILAFHALWGYLRLEGRVVAHVHKWKVVEISPSQFALKASYTFNLGEKVYKGKTVFSKPYDLNRLSAEKRATAYSTKPWHVWFSPKAPHNSSLERNFPIKKCLYSLMALGICLYFSFLSRKFVYEAVE